MIEELNICNIDATLKLFKKYQEFYQIPSINEEKNRQHLQTIMIDEELGKVFLIKDGKNYAGFATIYYSFSSRITQKIAILNDLYVEKKYRRRGFGKQLMDSCFRYLKDYGIKTVRWTTAQDNEDAQKLYNRYASGTKWLMYSYDLSSEHLV